MTQLMSGELQALYSYAAINVFLNVVAGAFYALSPLRRHSQFRVPIHYFTLFFILLAAGYAAFAMSFPQLNLLSIVATNSSIVLAFYAINLGFKYRKDPRAHERKERDYGIAALNLAALLFTNVGVFYFLLDDPVIRTAILSANCCLIFVATLKHVVRGKSASHGEKIALIGAGLSIVFSLLTLLILKFSNSMFTYMAALTVLQSLTTLIILGGTLTIFLSDLSEKYYEDSVTDELTGLYNRRYFLRQSDILVSSARRHDFPISIILCDIDDFKKVNDCYGHEAGDKALSAFSQILKSASRSEDICARIGGEEFVVLLPQTESSGAITLAERMRARLEAHTLETVNGKVDLTASFGVVTFDMHNSVELYLRQADNALYKAKQLGKNRVQYFEKAKVVSV